LPHLTSHASTLFGVLIGLVAVAGGVATVVTAILTRRRRDDIAETYAITGGVAYTVVQFGCGGVLILIGLVLVIAVVVNAH
jgi:uncharacterized membrane protein HdeD (DUF308 family)